uniref:LEC14B n=1 Tax=Arundo donax TaxID=35708 RepID=A0A0A9EW72_ARUDO
MGYGMSRLEEEYCEPEGQNTDGSSSVQVNDEFSNLHNDIFHMTRMRSGFSGNIYRSRGTCRGTISTAKILSGREVDCSGNGPELLDRMDSRAYVSQFSADVTLFVAVFQGSHIRIYDVDRGWNMHKDIHARSLRWTISDVSL